MDTQLLRIKDVCRATGLGRSTIYAFVADGKFPKPIKISERATGFINREVEDWMSARIADSRKSVA